MAGYLYRPTYSDKKTGEKRESQVWWGGYSVDGRKRRFSTKTRDRAEAQRALLRAMLDDESTFAEDLDPTFDDLADLIRVDYLSLIHISEPTRPY